MIGSLDKRKFYKDIKEIFPEGELEKAYSLMIEIINRFSVDTIGTPIDYDYIIDKFKKFHQNWNIKYGKSMAKGFLGKEAEASRQTIYQFLMQATYLKDFQVTQVNTDRDKYLFGDNFEKILNGIKQIEEELFR